MHAFAIPARRGITAVLGLSAAPLAQPMAYQVTA